MDFTTKLITDKNIWELFLNAHPEANFLQSWWWGQFHATLGNDIQRIGFFRGEKLTGVMLSVVESARRGRYLTVPAGPIIDWEDKELMLHFMSAMKEIAKAHNCAFIRVRPQLPDTDESRRLFRNLGFRPAPMHLHAQLTHQLDITKSEDELLSGMRKSTRYEIRQAQKQGVVIKSSKNPEDILSFYNLQLETAKRQGFVPFSLKFLQNQFAVFAQNNQAILYSAYSNKTVLAQAFIIFYGSEAVYHYGASTEEGRKIPGTYLIQWEAIREAKRRGMKRYNFWGVAREHETYHRFYNLSVFKRGFGGVDVAYLPAQDLVIDPIRYAVNFLIESFRKKVRNV